MKILYAEDEQQLSMAVSEILKMEGYDVTAVYDGEAAWNELSAGGYDGAILDIMMPKLDGIQVLSKMRGANDFTPVIMLTAKADIDDRIEGLSVGADDYIAKPFAMKELIARLNSAIRRSVRYKDTLIHCGNTTLDCATDELKTDRGSLRLSGKESELMALFMKHKGDVLKLSDVTARIWDEEHDESFAVLYISYIKNKLGSIHADISVFDADGGYCLKECDAE